VLHVYTIEQVNVFGEAAQKNADFDLAEAAAAFRAAQTTDAVWKKYLGHLSGRSKQPGKKAGKGAPTVMNLAQMAELKKLGSRKAR
jgi:hypothetical protein